jgi:hypothetical protein
MFRLDWGNPKISLGEFHSYLQTLLGEKFDGLVEDQSYLYIYTSTPLDGAEENSILEYVATLNAAPREVVTQLDKSTPKDSDGSPLQRIKITTTGWHYRLHGVEFETSKLSSIEENKASGAAFGFTALKFYKLDNGSEVEITGGDLNQTFLDANCVKTVMDWEPTHDYEILGGLLKQIEKPTENVRVWVVGVPDVPEAYGGSKEFVTNVNMLYIGDLDGVKVDGRAPKYLTYSSSLHTNKMRLIVRHSVGFKHKIMMVFEIFKA